MGYITQDLNNNQRLNLFIFGFISTPKKENITIDSIKKYNEFHYDDDFFIDSKLSWIQTKKGKIVITYKKMNCVENLIFDKNLIFLNNNCQPLKLNSYDFIKRIFLKNEITLLSYILEVDNNFKLILCVQRFFGSGMLIILRKKDLEYEIDFDEFFEEENADGIALSETKVIFLSFKYDYKNIRVYLVYYFDDYNNFLLTIFELKNIKEKIYLDNFSYFPLFKYKDLLGLRFENFENRQGFILFGYFNSTDPEPIYDLKKMV